jgi:hypothetical protein
MVNDSKNAKREAYWMNISFIKSMQYQNEAGIYPLTYYLLNKTALTNSINQPVIL